jgi:hypothetical protein
MASHGHTFCTVPLRPGVPRKEKCKSIIYRNFAFKIYLKIFEKHSYTHARKHANTKTQRHTHAHTHMYCLPTNVQTTGSGAFRK